MVRAGPKGLLVVVKHPQALIFLTPKLVLDWLVIFTQAQRVRRKQETLVRWDRRGNLLIFTILAFIAVEVLMMANNARHQSLLAERVAASNGGKVQSSADLIEGVISLVAATHFEETKAWTLIVGVPRKLALLERRMLMMSTLPLQPHIDTLYHDGECFNSSCHFLTPLGTLYPSLMFASPITTSNALQCM